MPVTSLDDFWGAGSPYGASGYPDNLPNMPYGPPGGGLMGLPGATPGAPSMGYPALGQPTQGLSLTSNPVADPWYLRLMHAVTNGLISPAEASELAKTTVPHGAAGGPNDPMQPPRAPSSPAASAPAPPAAPTANGPAPIGNYNSLVNQSSPGVPVGFTSGGNPSSMVADNPTAMWPTPPAGFTSGGVPIRSPASTSTAAPMPPSRPATPQGSPSQTPRPAASSADRWLIDRVNAGPVDQPRRGYQTALDLSQFFRKRG